MMISHAYAIQQTQIHDQPVPGQDLLSEYCHCKYNLLSCSIVQLLELLAAGNSVSEIWEYGQIASALVGSIKSDQTSSQGATVMEMVKNLCEAAALPRQWRSLVTSVTTPGSLTTTPNSMVRISDPETVDLLWRASSSKVKIVDGTSCCHGARQCGQLSVRLADGANALADFAFDKLPTELLVKVFKHARPDNIMDAHAKTYPTPLAQVCRYWRSVALDASTLWSNIYIMKYYTEKTRMAARISLERSKTCPLFLTWFSKEGQTNAEAQEVIDDLIIPYADRWQRITLMADGEEVADALVAAMGPLDFQILQDIEISRPSWGPYISELTLCRNAPLLRRCRLLRIPSLPPLPSNLVVLDYESVLIMVGEMPFDLDPLLKFLPHVAHSLEHLRFGPPSYNVSVTHPKPRILLPNLKSLLVRDSYTIMEHIIAPNLTYFAASLFIYAPEALEAAEMFHGFSAPKLQSIRFCGVPLLPLLTLHDLPSMFPQLESVMFESCDDESAFIDLLKPPRPTKPSSSRKAAEYPPKHRKVESPFPKLKELAIWDVENLASLQATIEKRRKNGDESLRTLRLSKDDVTEGIMRHLTRWLPKRGIELVLYERYELVMSGPSEFQDDFYDEESLLCDEIMDESEWSDEEDNDYDDYEDDEDDYDHDNYEEDCDGYELLQRAMYRRCFGIDSDEEEEEIGASGFYDV